MSDHSEPVVDVQTAEPLLAHEIRACALCGSADADQLYYPKRAPGPVVRCRECQLVYISPIVDESALIVTGPVVGDLQLQLLRSDNPAEFGDCWELAQFPSNAAEQATLQANARSALERIHAFAEPPGRLLDFGCGWGFFLASAIEMGWDAYGVEPLPAHSAHARSLGAKVVTDTLQSDTFPLGTFDVITAFQVFEHLLHPRKELAKLSRFLRPGGTILIEVPNIDTWGVGLMGKQHRHFVMDHVTFFSTATLKVLMNTSGIEPAETYFPTRRMTIRHLTDAWLAKYLPNSISSLIGRISNRLKLRNRFISCNLGDIVAVIGQKPLSNFRKGSNTSQ